MAPPVCTPRGRRPEALVRLCGLVFGPAVHQAVRNPSSVARLGVVPVHARRRRWPIRPSGPCQSTAFRLPKMAVGKSATYTADVADKLSSIPSPSRCRRAPWVRLRRAAGPLAHRSAWQNPRDPEPVACRVDASQSPAPEILRERPGDARREVSFLSVARLSLVRAQPRPRRAKCWMTSGGCPAGDCVMLSVFSCATRKAESVHSILRQRRFLISAIQWRPTITRRSSRPLSRMTPKVGGAG